MNSSTNITFDSFQIIDNTVVDVIIDQAKGDKQFVSMLFESFLTEGYETLSTVEVALKNKDYKTLGESVHALKGLAGTMGVSQVYEICKKIDASLKFSIIDEALVLLPLLSTKYQVAKEFITANYIIV